MSQKDSPEDIEKAYNLFVDPIKGLSNIFILRRHNKREFKKGCSRP